MPAHAIAREVAHIAGAHGPAAEPQISHDLIQACNPMPEACDCKPHPETVRKQDSEGRRSAKRICIDYGGCPVTGQCFT